MSTRGCRPESLSKGLWHTFMQSPQANKNVHEPPVINADKRRCQHDDLYLEAADLQLPGADSLEAASRLSIPRNAASPIPSMLSSSTEPARRQAHGKQNLERLEDAFFGAGALAASASHSGGPPGMRSCDVEMSGDDRDWDFVTAIFTSRPPTSLPLTRVKS